MYKHIKDGDAEKYLVINLDTKEVIRGVQWADDETDKYEKFVFNSDGGMIDKYNIDKEQYESVTEIKKGNILIVNSNSAHLSY